LICQDRFKDVVFGGTLRNLLAGDVDWPAVLGALRASGYRGWIGVEPVWYQLFVSPWGTGCSRYIHTCCLPDRVIATWQQSRSTGAQPLVMHSLSWDEIGNIVRSA
jgi:hypothetical protein